ncbi:MAG: universal stress protein [Acidobacteriota bacterium]
MLPFKKIVFPVDYSPPCQAVIPYVRDAVRHFDAQLMLVHAIVPQPLLYGEYAFANLIVPEDACATGEEALRAFAAEAFPGISVDIVVENGDPGVVIDEAIRRHGADLVMMPTHGLGPLRKLLLGSVTAKVLHDVSAAVWTGANALWADHAPALPYGTVLCALDRTPEAAVVLRGAAVIAHAYGARLFVYHAAQTPPPSAEFDVSTYSKEIMENARVWLRELQAGERIEALHTITDRAVGEGVREEALRVKADLIVVGRGNAQGGISRLWSHLYEVIREAPCPVLSI